MSFKFAAVGLDHPHILDHIAGLTAAGAVFAGYTSESTTPALVEEVRAPVAGRVGDGRETHPRGPLDRGRVHRRGAARPGGGWRSPPCGRRRT